MPLDLHTSQFRLPQHSDYGTFPEPPRQKNLLKFVLADAVRLVTTPFRLLNNALHRLVLPLAPRVAPVDELESMRRNSVAKQFMKENGDFRIAKQQGVQDGAQQLPPPTSRSPAEVGFLSAKLAAATTGFQTIRDRFESKRQEFARRLQSPLRDLEPVIRTEAKKVIDLAIKGVVTRTRNRIIATFQEAAREESRYRGWLEENGLDQFEPPAPRYVDMACLLLIAFLLETGFNAFVLEDASPYGFNGALGFASAIALANIVFGFATGATFGRMRCHVSIIFKTVGWLGCICLAALGVLLNCMVAVARHVILTSNLDIDQTFNNAGYVFVNNYDVIYRDLPAIWLLGASICFWTMAFFKGHHVAGAVYLGHNRHYDRFHYAQALAQMAFEEFELALAAIVTNARNHLFGLAASASAAALERQDNLALTERLIQFSDGEIAAIVETVYRLFDAYVSGNALTRGSMPPPIWFGRLLNFNATLPLADATVFDPCIEFAQKRADEAGAQVITAMQDIEMAQCNAVIDMRNACMTAFGEAVDPHEGGSHSLPPPTPSQLRRR